MKVETPQIIWHSKDSKFADRVYSLDFQPGTSRLATAGADEFIHIWEITRETEWKLKILSRLLGHEKEVNCIRFSSNGELLASGGQDDSLCIWRPTTEKQQVAFGHNSEDVLGFPEYWKRITVMRCMAPVISLSWSPDDCKVVVGTEDDRVTIWNVYNGKLLRQLDAHTHIVMGVCWDPKDELIASQSSDQTVRIWKSKTNKPKKKSKSITASNSNISDTKASPKEDVEVEINNKIGGNSEQTCTEIITHTGIEVAACTANCGEQQAKEEMGIESQNITSETPTLLVAPSESSTPVYDSGVVQNTAGQQANKSDIKSWKLYHTIKYEVLDNYSRQKQSNLDVDMSSDLVIGDCATPNNSKLSSNNNNIKRRCLFLAESATTSFFRRLDWSPKGEMLAVPTGQYLLNQESENDSGDNKSNQVLFPVSYIFLRDEYSYPVAVLPSPDGTTSSIRFNPVTFYPLKSSNTSQNPFFFNRITPQGGEDSWVFSNHGNHGEVVPRYIFSVITLAGTIYIYDTQHFHPIVCIRGLHFQGMNDASWSSDGHTLAVASSDGYITIIFFENGELGEVLIPSSVPTSSSINSTMESKEKTFQNCENDENIHQSLLKTNHDSECIATDGNTNGSVVSEKTTGISDNASTSDQVDAQIPPAKTKRRITPTVLMSYDS
ncbi:chromatin assembly factor 1 [Cryptosporidium sp. chipmunk genotype I]|uniref:chromatin assembly factor 1 n=1 Tax=Cryptosporidium sp. chipmunk genotype I TaxID=1280935 RepID=UPI00351A037E|nr:chromatin assembly factor 1 [Cryptosporidium sp. chipmunk genotype I]